MATKITILGEEPTCGKEFKKIEFVKGIDKHVDAVDFFNPEFSPSFYDKISVVRAYKNTVYDLFICYQNGNNQIHTYLGHFNDGIV